MALPPQFLDELRARVPVSEVVGQRVRLIRAGGRGEFKALCPFHKEKTPSFTVSDDKGFYYCFGCGAKGDAISFLVDHDRLSFMEAVEHLAGRAGLAVPKATPGDAAREERRKTLHDVAEAAAVFFRHQLVRSAGARARAYLDGRGVGAAARERFRLGYAPAEARLLVDHLAQGGFPEELIVEAGLARKPDEGGAAYAFFRDRLIFPVADRRGRVVGFGGRLLAGDGPKYINSPDTPVFQKGRLLYGLDLARDAARQGHPTLLVEGYMDVIALNEAGFAAAVAPLGTALTEDQVREAWRLSPTPVLCFDGDEAGLRAARRAAERTLPILMPDHSVKVAFLPTGEDPDSLVRGAGAAAMTEVLEAAQPLDRVVWEARIEAHSVETPEGRAGLLAGLLEEAGRIADNGVREAYRATFRSWFDRSYGWAPRRGGRGAAHSGPGRRPAGAAPAAGPSPRRPRRASEEGEVAMILLAAVLAHPELFDEFGEYLWALRISDTRLNDLTQSTLAILGGDPGLDSDALRRQLTETGQSEALERLSRQRMGMVGRAPFLRPGVPVEVVRERCREVMGLKADRRVHTERGPAERSYAEDPSEANRLRVLALRSEDGLDGEEEDTVF